MDFLYRLLFCIFFCCSLYGEVTAQTEMELARVPFKYKQISPKKECSLTIPWFADFFHKATLIFAST